MEARILAIDFGQARVGLAVTSPGATIALPLSTLHVKKGDLWKQLDCVMDQYKPHTVVIGLPLSLDGRDSGQTQKTRRFIELFGQRYGQCSLYALDERLSSKQADQMLHERGMNRKQRAQANDQTSAWILLSCYLDQNPTFLTQSKTPISASEE